MAAETQGPTGPADGFGCCAFGGAIVAAVFLFILVANRDSFSASPGDHLGGVTEAFFLALLLPAAVIGVVLLVVAWYRSKKPGDRDNTPPE